MKTIHVVAAIIKKDHQIVIAKRNKGEFKDLWEFPGGKVEENESNEVALIREIKEELHISITDLKHFHTVHYDYPNFHLIMDCYLCTSKDEQFILNDHSELKWITLQELPTVAWVPADVEVIEKLRDHQF